MEEPGEQGRASSFHSLGLWQPWPPQRGGFLLPLPLTVRRLGGEGTCSEDLPGRTGYGKQRCLEDKVWEVTGRGCVWPAWDCESRGGEGVRWPSFQAASYVPPTSPRLQEGTLSHNRGLCP